MKNKLTKYVIRILAGILGILTIAVTLFLFLYIFWKGKNVMSLSFILDKPAGVPLGTAGGIYPALMGSIYLGALSALMGGNHRNRCGCLSCVLYKEKYILPCNQCLHYRTVRNSFYSVRTGRLYIVDLSVWPGKKSFMFSYLCGCYDRAVYCNPCRKDTERKGNRIHEEFTGTWNVQRICGHTINSSGLCSGIAWNGGAWNGIRNGSGCTDFVYGCGYGRRCSGKTYGSIYVIAVSSVYAGK